MSKYKLKPGKVGKSLIKAYESIEEKFVDGYKKVEKKFVDSFLEEIKPEENHSEE